MRLGGRPTCSLLALEVVGMGVVGSVSMSYCLDCGKVRCGDGAD